MSGLLLNFILILILSIVSVTDYRHFRIPNICCLALGCLGIVESFLKHQSFIECVLGFMSINVVLVLIYASTQKKGIGGGDIKLLSASGILLGWQKNVLAFLIASLSVLSYYVIFIKKNKRNHDLQKNQLAFGPYLSFGILVSYFTGDIIINWYSKWPGI